MKEASPWKALKGQCLLGGADFIERLSPLLKLTSALLEIPKVDRMLHRPDLASLFPTPERVDKTRRNQAIREAYREHGYSQKEIADHLGLHYTTVSNILRNVSQNKRPDPFLLGETRPHPAERWDDSNARIQCSILSVNRLAPLAFRWSESKYISSP